MHLQLRVSRGEERSAFTGQQAGKTAREDGSGSSGGSYRTECQMRVRKNEEAAGFGAGLLFLPLI